MVYLVPHFQFCALVGAFLFKMAPKHSVEMLSSVLKHKKAVIFLMETIHELDKLIQGWVNVLLAMSLG